ncbi:MAG: AarF/ABC1/UbiB kinase family protein [Candidatus Woesearchaeota archaeon]|nr:MAG: AarF/ABC1/UbiB kinase family protein [Candidatus Woesearchaeota archaeon]
MTIAQSARDASRLAKIASVFVKYGFGNLIEGAKLHTYLPFVPRRRFSQKLLDFKRSQAERLKNCFEELGPTFIKLGQLLSLRPDLIPEEYCNEFRKLQDQVKGFDFKIAKRIIEEELKINTDEVFKEIKETLIASASIGQVHEAFLRNGERVVIKVQRQHIESVIRDDIDIMYHVAAVLEGHKEEFKELNLTNIVKEFERYTKEEMDYTIEARHISRFGRHFAGDFTVAVPKVYWDYTTKKVLVMSYLDGVKINDLKNSTKAIDKTKFAQTLAKSYFKQVFRHGFFHADPHPANILAIKSDRVGFLDFGIIGSLDEYRRGVLQDLFIALVRKDMENIVNGFVDLGVISKNIDNDKFKQDLSDYLGEYYDKTMEEINPGRLYQNVLRLAIRNKANVPRDLVLLSKAFVTAEGLGRTLDPSFNFTQVVKPYIEELAHERSSPIRMFKEGVKDLLRMKKDLSKVPRLAVDVLERIKEQDFVVKHDHEDVRELEREVGRSTNKIILGLLIAALIIGSSWVLSSGKSDIVGWSGFLMAGVLILVLIYSVVREKKVLI